MKIFVGNLNFRTTEQELGDIFATYGAVDSVKIITDKFTGQSRGFAFVEMSDAAAEKAIGELNGSDVGGRNIVVNESKPKSESGSFNRGGRY